MTLLEKARAIGPELVKTRRDIHAHPELSFQENRTAGLVADRLRKLGYDVRTGIAVTGCIGELVTGPGRTVALRADMDALPIQEANEVPYRSQRDGVMHACGHDAHVACLLGAARLLAEAASRGELPKGRIRLLFQPSEETTDAENKSGARRLIEEGAMEGVDAVIGLHVAAEAPVGEVLLREGLMMAGNDTLRGVVEGVGAHAALPHEGLDAVLLAAHVVQAAHSIVSRRIDPLASAVITFGKIEGGTAENIVASAVHLEGTLRYFERDVRQRLHAELRRAFAVADALGGTGRLEISEGYPPLVNDGDLTALVRAAASEIGEPSVASADMIMGAEDFAFLGQEAPGCFFWLGAGIDDDPRNHHSPRFDIDERCLPVGAAVLAAAAGKVLVEP
ncbi:MAG: amidohydrolase [Gemmatimonadetes bacterium]|uniref:Amidohydrolase n=1 Tax=Candidatus Kutchimonas denitrificans TaxID=3056748 RepID=A0AAE4Z675_9BACT|nr:amidohydrolase [Gemmatimonadota bacterium]NIR74348.1 amidohydrolase [Candidatus Kutchimonas denitrificans]NIS02599.1 amidohydrolase [Gemmatimonadota bacterium]NIT68474.1 amidohydrolase [Gemmatimonadota bacterium]NIU51951.1 amidohydrolase [Gemmatimonadota bacterium]